MKYPTKRLSRIAPFEDRYIPEPITGCWLWIGLPNLSGYGWITINWKRAGAHRVSWERRNGPVPEGLQVLHKCDTPPCVNPDHLFLGTHRDNMVDKTLKGRNTGAALKGEAHIGAKCTEAEVLKMRAMHREGMNTAQIAREFNRPYPTVYDIIRNTAWTHI